jgi:hypothetical protein
MTFNWGEVKAEIERLYMKDGKSLDEVRDILKATRNFHPSFVLAFDAVWNQRLLTLQSIRAYKDKLEEWGYRKYNRRRKGAAAPTCDPVQDLKIGQTTESASALVY